MPVIRGGCVRLIDDDWWVLDRWLIWLMMTHQWAVPFVSSKTKTGDARLMISMIGHHTRLMIHIYMYIYIYYIHIYTRVMYTYYSLMKRESCSWRRCAVNFIIFFSSCDIYMPIFWGGNWCDCIEDWLVIYKLPGTSYLSSRHRHVSWHILSVIRFRSSLRSVLYQTCDTRVDIAAGILVADKKWGDMLEPACTCATTAAAVGAPCHFL